MKYCPKCDSVIHEDAIFCQYCGHNTTEPVTDPDQQTDESNQPTRKRPEILLPPTPGKTFFGVIFQLLTLWGLTILTAVGLLYFLPDLPPLYLLLSLLPQVALRIFIALRSIEDQKFDGAISLGGQIGLIVLSLIPFGSLVVLIFASRDIIRHDRFDFVTVTGVIVTVAAALSATSTYQSISSYIEPITQDPVLALATPNDAGPAQEEQANPQDEGEVSMLQTPMQNTPESDSQISSNLNCQDPASITVADKGKTLEVCGKVTNYGVIECETCPKGIYSFIKLNGTFQIVSYDWRFTFAWLDDCLKVSDEVEMLGEKPVFVFGKGEGYAGTECITDARGELICEGGEYFQEYFGCQE